MQKMHRFDYEPNYTLEPESAIGEIELYFRIQTSGRETMTEKSWAEMPHGEQDAMLARGMAAHIQAGGGFSNAMPYCAICGYQITGEPTVVPLRGFMAGHAMHRGCADKICRSCHGTGRNTEPD